MLGTVLAAIGAAIIVMVTLFRIASVSLDVFDAMLVRNTTTKGKRK